MNNANKEALFKILLTICVVSAFLPVMVFFSAHLEIPAIYTIIFEAELILCAVMGVFHGLFTHFIQKTHPFLAKMSYFVVSAGLAFLSGLLYENLLLKIAAGLIIFFAYNLAIKYYYKPLSDIFSIYIFLVPFALNIICCIMLETSQKTYPKAFMLAVMIISAIVSITVKNQQNIDFMIERRGQSTDYLPTGIHIYNLKILGIIFAFAVGLSAFCVPLAGGLKTLLQTSGKGIISAILMLAEMFGYDANTDEVIPEETTETTVTQMVNSSSETSPLPMILTILLGLAVIYVNRHHISAGGRKLISRIKRFFLTGYDKEEIMQSHGEFTDYIENVSGIADMQSRSEDLSRRQWKTEYRKYLKMPENDTTFKTGYSLAYEGLRLCGIDVSPSDTPLELLKKSEEFFNAETSYNTATNAFNLLEYNDLSPDSSENSALDTALHIIQNNI